MRLEGTDPLAVVVVHRDADNAGYEARRSEIESAMASISETCLVPVIPVRMTEAWLLLDERQIRAVAGNPKGTNRLDLPKRHEVESLADPKMTLQQNLLTAAAA